VESQPAYYDFGADYDYDDYDYDYDTADYAYDGAGSSWVRGVYG
jgi:hypothetical protein